MKLHFFILFLFITITTTFAADQFLPLKDEEQDKKIVYLPQEVREIFQVLQLVNEQQEDFIDAVGAQKLIQNAQQIIDDVQNQSDPVILRMKTYLQEYQLYINSPETTGTRARLEKESAVVLDLWVQHALRARLLSVDNYATIKGDLTVGGDAVLNGNASIEENVLIGGSLTVNGPANFIDVFIGGSSGCTGGSGVLRVCGDIIINGITVTGPFGPQGATGTTGSTGPQGPQGVPGPPGFLGPTAASLTLVDTTQSNGCDSGALIVYGGVGVGGNLNVCGYINTFADYQLDSSVILNATGTNLSVGFDTPSVANGSNNVSVGLQANQGLTTGTSNTSIGVQAGLVNNASNNTIIGALAGNELTTGTDNTFIGASVGGLYSSSNRVTCIGSQAGGVVNGGDDTVSIGYGAGYSSASLSESVIIGSHAGTQADGNGNVIIGYRAGQSAMGGGNTFIGYQAGITNISGFDNTCIGYQANVASSNLTNATAIGADAVVNGSNQIQLGAANTNVLVSTPGDSGALYLPTLGGTPTGLSYYETVTMPIQVIYNNSVVTVSTTLYITRIGNAVTLTVDPILPAGNPGSGNGVFVFQSFLPARFCPPVSASDFISQFAGPVTEVYNVPGNRFIGEWVVYGNGTMIIQTIYQGGSQVTFNGDEYQTLGQLSISYSINP